MYLLYINDINNNTRKIGKKNCTHNKNEMYEYEPTSKRGIYRSKTNLL